MYFIEVIGRIAEVNCSIGLSEPRYEQNEGLLVSDRAFFTSITPNYVESRVLGIKKNSKWRHLVEKYFPEEEVETALMIMQEESRGNPNAVNWRDYHRACGCNGSFGLFQIGRIHMGSYGYTWNNRFDPETNVRVAYEVWKVQGWKRGWKNSYQKIQ